ncbi:unnamed protein product (macronuclear) [Paramecium tetraurelia]|uniref:Uncharacterized protein n=1 Tax=Paramecium tetraurelia TaxID=5888 RepID=A0BP38_PARTE|nr:uncharacterized protein GSPATT00005054001 [Paramecium tetraurelia]CAK60305.1 unnamed protein product [Paramecium tetraurelia]|eukprot:XP_001427703.1 hypothetical protein (macronuclear) [Paramecium tetraurelia strain d4-2]
MQAKRLVLDPFCYRQFGTQGSQQILYDREKFVEKVNELYRKEDLKDGYAPFCKHIFIENFTETPNYILKITQENEYLIKTAYKARNERELPVLTRFIPAGSIELQKAKFLDIILYSKEQITKENKSQGVEDIHGQIDYDFGIISIKPQDENTEIPMLPITSMRNSLGTKEGGSGVEMNREEYLKSVNFWSKHILVE